MSGTPVIVTSARGPDTGKTRSRDGGGLGKPCAFALEVGRVAGPDWNLSEQEPNS